MSAAQLAHILCWYLGQSAFESFRIELFLRTLPQDVEWYESRRRAGATFRVDFPEFEHASYLGDTRLWKVENSFGSDLSIVYEFTAPSRTTVAECEFFTRQASQTIRRAHPEDFFVRGKTMC